MSETSTVLGLPNLPPGWECVPFWTRFQRIKTTDCPSEQLLSVYRDFGVIPKADRDDNFNKASEDLSTYQLVTPGDLVVNKMKAWQGSLGISDHQGIVSPAYFVFRQINSEDSRYLNYLLRSQPYAAHFASVSTGIRPNQWDLDPNALRNTPLLVPLAGQQHAIADFLDLETAEIDAFIADQERLIELLTERRAATVSHFIMHGLDEQELSRSANLGWAASVPAHWQTTQVKRLFDSMTYGTSEASTEGPITAVGMGDVNDGCVNLVDRGGFPTVPPGLDLREGDLLFNRTNSLALVGKVGLVQSNASHHTFASYLVRCRPLPTTNAEWANYALNCLPFWRYAQGFALPSISQANLSSSRYGALSIILPPQREQIEIARCLNDLTLGIDTTIADARRAIELSRERRAALITAAVTGQVDVRAGRPKIVGASCQTGSITKQGGNHGK